MVAVSDNDSPRELESVLSRYTGTQARLHRLAHDARLMPALRTGVPQLAHAELRAFSNATAPTACCWIELVAAGEHCWLGLDASQAPALYSLVLVPSPAETAVALRCAVATQLLAPLLRALAALSLPDLEVRSLTAVRPSAAARDCWRIALHREDEPPLSAWITAMPESWITHLASRLTAHGEGMAALARITLPGRLLLGQLSIRIQTMRDWRPGDVLIRPLPQAQALRDGLPISAALRWHATAPSHTQRFFQSTVEIDGDRITINEAPRMTQALNEDVPNPDAPEIAQAFDALELPVQIEIAAMALAAAEIGALRPGQVLTLPMPVRDSVLRLTVYGQLVAHGELVCVGDHLGIRIRDAVCT